MVLTVKQHTAKKTPLEKKIILLQKFQLIELILAMESKRKRKASEKLNEDDENEKKMSKITSKAIDKKLGE